MRRVPTLLSIVLVLLVAATGCRSLTGKSLGQNIDDRTITATVKTELTKDRAKNLTSVDVDTNQGVVYLTGNVATAQQKADAARIAGDVKGVTRVINNLQVEPAAFGATRSTESTPRSQSAAAASPATGDFMGRHTMTGEVTKIDRDKGHVQLRTAEGEMELHFPPATLQNVREGDRITVELAMRPMR